MIIGLFLLGFIVVHFNLAAADPNWGQINGGLTNISPGKYSVWGIMGTGTNIYYTDSLGLGANSWSRPEGGGLNQINAGKNNVWGISPINQIFIRTGVSCSNLGGNAGWTKIDPPAGKTGLWVTCSDYDNGVWLIANDQTIWFRNGVSDSNPSGTDWQSIDGALVQIQAAKGGVWGVASDSTVWYRSGTYENTNTPGGQWVKVDGGLTDISVGNNVVYGVNSADGSNWYRNAISACQQTGNGWTKLSSTYTSFATNSDGAVWALQSGGSIYKTGI